MPTGARGTGPVAPGNLTGRRFADLQRARHAQVKRERALAERDAAEAEAYLDGLTRGGELTPVHDPVTQAVVYYLDRDGNEVPA
jgi:hypothetical protein